jgi:hypothetical protein
MGHINHLVINLLSSLTTDQADVTDDERFYGVLASHVQISSIETSLNGHIRLYKTMPIDPQTLATHWMISPERAKQTVIMTMQRGCGHVLTPPFHDNFQTMTECFGINVYCILCSATRYLPGPFHDKTIKWPKWQQATEGCIRELKRGSSRKMIKTGSPKCLWDHCLELEAYVCSCTSNYIYITAGQVPETTMTGNTADISHIAEFG